MSFSPSLVAFSCYSSSLRHDGGIIDRFFTFSESSISTKGRHQNKKKLFNSGIARITQPPPPPPNSGNFTNFVRRGDHLRDFYLSKKTVQKNSGKGKPPPQIRAMPELKRFF